MKIRIIIALIFFTFVGAYSAFAETVDNHEYYGTTSTIETYMVPNAAEPANIWFDVKVDGTSSDAYVIWYDYYSDAFQEISRFHVTSMPVTVDAPSGAVGFKLQSNDGLEIHAVVAHSDNPINETVTFDGPPTSGSTDGSTDGSTSCDFCSCPGWDEISGKLDTVIGKMNPPPDWDIVAATFRDTIVPALMSDMKTWVGTAPTPPAPPAQPSMPTKPDPVDPAPVDDRGIEDQEPQMQTPEGLGDAADQVTEDNIKNQAPVIPKREDPTGGFDLNDPVDALPDMPTDDLPIPGQTDAGPYDHQPAQPDIPVPEPPEKSATAPTSGPVPSGDSGTAPVPDGGDATGPVPSGTDYSGSLDYKDQPSPESPTDPTTDSTDTTTDSTVDATDTTTSTTQ